MPQCDRRGHDRRVGRAHVHLLDERAVYLDLVHREAREVAQRRVTRAIIVDGNAHSQRGQTLSVTSMRSSVGDTSLASSSCTTVSSSDTSRTRLAVYMAMSACRSSVSASTDAPHAGLSAIPMLTPMRSACPSTTNGASGAARTVRAMIVAAFSSLPGSRMANSSPPSTTTLGGRDPAVAPGGRR